MKAVELKNGIYWVGAIDWAVRDFHGYETPRGTTYNNYLIMDDEITLMDTVKYDFSDSTIKNIRSVVDPSKIRHVVINHIENDHVTSIDKIMDLTPNAIIYITEKGKKGLDRFFDTTRWNIKTVKTGDTLNIGKKTLLFIETPMLHWPDSMMTYIKEDKILISQDAFGQHIASAVRFDDEFVTCESMSELEDAVIDYYANILMPFGQLIKAKIADIQKLGIEIEMIAPDHGIIWKANPQKVMQMYLDMANGKTNLSVSIIYDTMWHSTEQMTLPIMQGLKDEGVECKVIKLRATPMSVAIKEFWKSRGALIGTPTLNNIMYPSVAHFLTHLRGLRPKNRIVGAFGSYGWGGGAVKEAYEDFKRMGLEIFDPGLQILYKPSFEDETKCYEFGREFAKKVKEYHQKF
ncbi:MAG: FprA family A-type flavoprotein [Nitrospiraceae bacterium]|jgi:flavorubredoxin|nr:FprA family A-type flavoprotein [Nitrospirota bacterium]MDA8339266.1 FprA family A-type flavoprotein [Nitrospiraceae bacterium]